MLVATSCSMVTSSHLKRGLASPRWALIVTSWALYKRTERTGWSHCVKRQVSGLATADTAAAVPCHA